MTKHPALTLIARPPARLPCSTDAVRAALALVVKSPHFAKAFRCTTLLSYLVERALAGDNAAPPPEHEVGVAVFGRDPDSYFPGDDPIVRVQAGRLRLRLAAYYDGEGAAEPWRISVPAGRYQAVIAAAEAAPAAPLLLKLRPLLCLDFDPRVGNSASAFATGLDAELEYRLYHALGRAASPLRLCGTAIESPQRASHLLEGSVRQDSSRLRVSLQLRGGEEGTLLWCAQFDCAGQGSIDSQEQLAERCIGALLPHLPQRAGGGVMAIPARNGNDTIDAASASLL